MAEIAADPTADLGSVRNPSPALHAVLALGVLLVARAGGAQAAGALPRPGREALPSTGDVTAFGRVGMAAPLGR
jgi:hypothetical protein